MENWLCHVLKLELSVTNIPQSFTITQGDRESKRKERKCLSKIDWILQLNEQLSIATLCVCIIYIVYNVSIYIYIIYDICI